METLRRKILGMINEELDRVTGGNADKMSIEDIAKKHSVTVEMIKRQLIKGQKIELEHTNDDKLAKEIAMDHLEEIPDYYDRLEKMESNSKK